MSLISISINDFRNLSQSKIDLSDQCNIFYGQNGSGKTSFLEAIHYLALGRSFRSHILRRIIKHQAKSFSIFAEIKQKSGLISVGTSRSIETGKITKINGKPVSSSVETARILPLQLLNHDSYSLLYDGPKIRRQFIDRGLFHVEQSFLEIWKKIDRILNQRNISIRTRKKIDEIILWDKQLAEFGQKMHNYREKHVEEFLPVAKGILQSFLPDIPIDITYHAGWDLEMGLETALSNNINRDIQLGYTSLGPQRADLRIKSGTMPAKDLLSRGQQKMLIYGLQIAQGNIISSLAPKGPIYLVDDLLAELDSKKCELLAETVCKAEKTQLFVTGLVKKEISSIFGNHLNNKKIFHIENNLIKEK